MNHRYTWMIFTDDKRPELIAHGFDDTRHLRPIRTDDRLEALRLFLGEIESRSLLPTRIQFVQDARSNDGANLRAWTVPA